MTRQINFIDCSLRDGHQSLLATRMTTEQCMRVLPMLKDSGYQILELWGGATLDAALRFTHDNPWERLDQFRKTLGKGIQIRSLCRAQNLFGYSPYPDNVVYEFLKEAVRSGNDRIRIFDAMNDPRNLLTAIMSVKTHGGHAEAAMSYTVSPVHDTDHFIRFAEYALDNGADSLAIKDMAGLLHPADCFELIDALREKFGDVQITLHSHCTNGLAITTYLAAMVAGVNNLDTCYGPVAGNTSQPPIELLEYFCREMGFKHNVDMKLTSKIDAELRQIRKELVDSDKDPDFFGNPWPADPTPEVVEKIKQVIPLIESRDRAKLDQAIAIIEDEILVPQGYPEIDRKQIEAQIPGGMLSNLHKQLKDQGKLDMLPQILEEVPIVRKDTGYIPLVTPTSQIVGTQASFNILTGKRYGMLTNEFRNIMIGKYGRTPGTPNAEIVRKCAEAEGTEVCTERPANYAAKVDLEQVYADHKDVVKSHRDLLLVLLFPAPAKALLKEKQQESS